MSGAVPAGERRIGGPVTVDARAKLNLSLEVLGRRPDGYHEIRSLMQSVALADRLTIRANGTGRIRIRCPGSDLPQGVEADGNLAVRAARLLQDVGGRRQGADIVLYKRIPVGAGLGGGSSDAAAVLVVLNRLWGLRYPRRDLMALGARIGSDVPFFIRGGTQLARGRGEILTPLPALPRLPVAIIDPSHFLSTASIYNSQNLQLTPRKALLRLRACDLTSRSATISCIAKMRNDLEPEVVRRSRKVARILRDFRALRSEVVRITGSGSCIFIMARDQIHLNRLLEDAPVRGLRVHMTRFAGRSLVSVVPRGA